MSAAEPEITEQELKQLQDREKAVNGFLVKYVLFA